MYQTQKKQLEDKKKIFKKNLINDAFKVRNIQTSVSKSRKPIQGSAKVGSIVLEMNSNPFEDFNLDKFKT